MSEKFDIDRVQGLNLGLSAGAVAVSWALLSLSILVLCLGVDYRRLGVDSIEKHLSSGVFYGASPSEARSFAGVDVAVVGGGVAGVTAARLDPELARGEPGIIGGRWLCDAIDTSLIAITYKWCVISGGILKAAGLGIANNDV